MSFFSKVKGFTEGFREMAAVTSASYTLSEFLSMHGFYKDMSDEEYLKMLYRKFNKGKRELNLENPTRFTDKLQWLKLYDRREFYHTLVDKVEVKKYVADRIGQSHVIPTLGVYDTFDEIDFDALPDRFVLKCTHDSGGIRFCRDKKTFDRAEAREYLTSRLSKDPYPQAREFAYKGIRPRLICEPLIDELGKRDSVEYKITCFDGKAKMITVCEGIAHDSLKARTNDFYDRDWNFLPFYTAYYLNSGHENLPPKELPAMLEICDKLAEGIPEVRVDLYLIDGQVLFGEMTFYTWGGFINFVPDEWDEKLGSWFTLPPKTLG